MEGDWHLLLLDFEICKKINVKMKIISYIAIERICCIEYVHNQYFYIEYDNDG